MCLKMKIDISADRILHLHVTYPNFFFRPESYLVLEKCVEVCVCMFFNLADTKVVIGGKYINLIKSQKFNISP